MNLEAINDDNFLLFAAKHYHSRLAASTAEFKEDLNRIKYIRKLITRYQQNDELKIRLLLNHITVLHNVFPPEICCKILLFKLSDMAKYVKPFLLFLNILPAKLYNIDNQEVVETDIIEMDLGIVEALRRI